MRYSIILLIMLLVISCSESNKKATETAPNIVIIYMDDLGYGDLSSYGATEIHTPNIDSLSNGGIRFTDAHSSSATCTPSRYALLTGTYPWRNKRAKILPGTAPLIIDTAQQTLPKILKQAGYKTGIVGKWHLGLGNGNVDWNKHISPGPNEVGFDYSYIMAATQDRVPTVYIENGNVVGLDPNDPIQVNYKENFAGEPTGLDNPELLKMKASNGHNNSIVNGIGRIGFMKGGDSAKWSDIDMADHFLAKAKEFVKQNKSKPFFLYYALQQPHVPRTPHPRFEGKTALGARGDVIVEADWCVGEFMNTLKAEGLLENTLIILSSDNGPVIDDGYMDEAVEKLGKHTPSGVLRGGKYSLFEAGTRVPFITYWKGKINSGTSDATLSQMDLLSSLASLVGEKASTIDSENLLSTLLGKQTKGRTELIVEASGRLAFKKDNWVMIPPHKGAAVYKYVNIESGNSPEYQLYNLDDDIKQQNNLAKSHTEKLQEMIDVFNSIQKK